MSRAQTDALNDLIEANDLDTEPLILAHVALALSRIADQLRGHKDIMRDMRDILTEAFPVAEGDDEH